MPLKTSRLAPLLFLSLALHMGLVVYLQSKSVKSPPPTQPNKARVQTVYLKAETPKVTKAPPLEKAIAKTPLPEKITLKAPPPQKTAPAKLQPKPQKAIAKATPAKKNTPVAKAKEKTDNPPKKIPTLSHAYAQEIAVQLKLLLSLPEYGEVTVSMQLLTNGKIAKVEILESQSTANEKYLLEMLPKLTLPPPPNGETPLKLTLSNA